MQANRAKQNRFYTKKKLLLLIKDGLIESIKKLSANAATTAWSNYYSETILSDQYLKAKEAIFREYLNSLSFDSVLDLGANDGYFSKIAGEKATSVIATDFDSKCINNLYKEVKATKTANVLPLVIDISNPSPAIGFNNEERNSFINRAQYDLVLALALIHHLVFTKNVPLSNIASLLHTLTKTYLIIEFVPLSDEKTKELIKNKTEYHLP